MPSKDTTPLALADLRVGQRLTIIAISSAMGHAQGLPDLPGQDQAPHRSKAADEPLRPGLAFRVKGLRIIGDVTDNQTVDTLTSPDVP